RRAAHARCARDHGRHHARDRDQRLRRALRAGREVSAGAAAGRARRGARRRQALRRASAQQRQVPQRQDARRRRRRGLSQALARFDGYAVRGEPANGLAGQRVAHVDELLFLPVPDYATRQAGIVTGEYHYIQQIKPDQYDRIKGTPGVEPVVVKPYGWATIVLNTKQGLMTDKRLRQAMQAALDVEPLMLAGLGHKEFYRLDPGIVFQEQPYHSRVGAAAYNQHDREKAKRLLKEAGYAGQPVRWLVTTEYEHHYKPTLVAKSQLEE